MQALPSSITINIDRETNIVSTDVCDENENKSLKYTACRDWKLFHCQEKQGGPTTHSWLMRYTLFGGEKKKSNTSLCLKFLYSL